MTDGAPAARARPGQSSGDPRRHGRPPAPKARAVMKPSRAVAWTAQVVAAAILGQTLFFKFTAAPESVAIFRALGAEPWGRIASGAVELVAVVCLLTPRWAAVGGLIGAGTITGAILAHLTRLGIEVEGDGGTLFVLALVTWVACATVLWIRRGELPRLGRESAGRAA